MEFKKIRKDCEELWAKNKYYVLSKSHKVYLEIREYLKEKEVDFLFLNEKIQRVRNIEESKKDFSNAILHVWGKKHKTVDYVFLYSPYHLFMYHLLVMDEMEKRGYKVSIEWRDKNYRGKQAEKYDALEEKTIDKPIYKEHNAEYMTECIENLQKKGIELEV